MTIKNPQGRPDVEEVLLQFAAEQALPTASQLNQYIEAYPEFKSELIDLQPLLINDKFYVEAPDTEEAETIAETSGEPLSQSSLLQVKRSKCGSFHRRLRTRSRVVARAVGALVDLLGIPKKVVAAPGQANQVCYDSSRAQCLVGASS
jgi:hypothetical protein